LALKLKLHGNPAWVTVKFAPLTLTEADRGAVVELAATERLTGPPLPLPDTVPVGEIQLGPVSAVQAHPAGAVTLNEAGPPDEETEIPVLSRLNEHPTPA
jgi:hypothetical protein